MDIRETTQKYNAEYNNHLAIEEAMREKITKLRSQIERVEKRIAYLSAPSWVDAIIQPIVDELAAKHPHLLFEKFGPHGLGSTVGVHASDRAKMERALEDERVSTDGEQCMTAREAQVNATLYTISFRPTHPKPKEIVVEIVDYSHVDKEYPKGSLGAINGLGYGTIPIENFEQIEAILFSDKE
jgi:hypothetical protein